MKLRPPNPQPGLHPNLRGKVIIDVDAEEVTSPPPPPTPASSASSSTPSSDSEPAPLKYDNIDVILITLLLSYTIVICFWLTMRTFLPGMWAFVPNWVTCLLFVLPFFALPSMQFSAKIDAVYTVTVFGKDTGMRLGPGLAFLFPLLFKTAESPMADQVDAVGEKGKFVLTCRFTNLINEERGKLQKTIPRTKVWMSLKVHWRIIDPYLAQVKMGLQPGDAILWGSDNDGNPGRHRKRLLDLILPEVEKIIQTQANDSEVEAVDVVSGGHNRAIESRDNINALNAVMIKYGVEILRLSPSNPKFERPEDAAAVADAGKEPLEKNKEIDDADATMALFDQIYDRLIARDIPPDRAAKMAMEQANASQGKIDLTLATLLEKIGLGSLFGKTKPASEQPKQKGRKNGKPPPPTTT